MTSFTALYDSCVLYPAPLRDLLIWRCRQIIYTDLEIEEDKMQTVNIADLKNNLSAYLEQVRQGEELIVKDRNRLIARLLPMTYGENLDAEEEALVAAGLMRLPTEPKSDDFWKLPAPDVELKDIVAAVQADRNED
ncbi:MAG: type II toxin-antitoxin system Phd/YefM family antitoxin [Blastocatellia bacterium]